jgi:hypothetical protein
VLALVLILPGCRSPSVRQLTEWFYVRQSPAIEKGIVLFAARKIEFCFAGRPWSKCVGSVRFGSATVLDNGKAVVFGGIGSSGPVRRIVYRDSREARDLSAVFPYPQALMSVSPERDRLVFVTPTPLVSAKQVHVVVTDIFGTKLQEMGAALAASDRGFDIAYDRPKFGSDGTIYFVLYRNGWLERDPKSGLECRIATIVDDQFQVVDSGKRWKTACVSVPWSNVLGKPVSDPAGVSFSVI